MDMKYERTEYPRPQFRRGEWAPLNGEWEFAFDDKDEGKSAGWQNGAARFGMRINVPFSYQYAASGIGLENETHEIVWYKRAFTIAKEHKGKCALLCFNGCDYIADVWVNGIHAVSHVGGFAPFHADITNCLKEEGENVLVVRCFDPLDESIPRGKQSWTGKRFTCFYIPNTGIWQSVWIDFFGEDCIENYSLFPDIDTCSFGGEISTLRALADEVELVVRYNNEELTKRQRFSLDGKRTRYSVSLMETDFQGEAQYWSPSQPNLFYVEFILYKSGAVVDRAQTRFGMRKIDVSENGQSRLNNARLYQRLVLDQGYWKESGLTPPSANALKEDILLAKKMGFNGARKHQKIEDPYFYYYAEELGFLTWCEMPSAYNFNADEATALSAQWQEILVMGARNFTSNVCYVLLNESWGVRKIGVDKQQQDFARGLYYTTKGLSPDRLISTNDGWENLDITDLVTIHDYATDSSAFAEKYTAEKYDEIYPQGRKLMADGCKYAGQPVIFSEFGGIAMQSAAKGGAWGYGAGAESAEAFFKRFDDLFAGVYGRDFQGFCYTQLTDVQQEVNGLLYEDRTPKFDLERVKKTVENRKGAEK